MYVAVCIFFCLPRLLSHIYRHTKLLQTRSRVSFFKISKVTLQRLPPSFSLLHLHKIFLLLLNGTSFCSIRICLCDFAYNIIGHRQMCECVNGCILPSIVLVLCCWAPQCVELMNVCSGVISLSQMCNEPCFGSVTFGLIDYK